METKIKKADNHTAGDLQKCFVDAAHFYFISDEEQAVFSNVLDNIRTAIEGLTFGIDLEAINKAVSFFLLHSKHHIAQKHEVAENWGRILQNQSILSANNEYLKLFADATGLYLDDMKEIILKV